MLWPEEVLPGFAKCHLERLGGNKAFGQGFAPPNACSHTEGQGHQTEHGGWGFVAQPGPVQTGAQRQGEPLF